jgi:hypothetical protein
VENPLQLLIDKCCRITGNQLGTTGLNFRTVHLGRWLRSHVQLASVLWSCLECDAVRTTLMKMAGM